MKTFGPLYSVSGGSRRRGHWAWVKRNIPTVLRTVGWILWLSRPSFGGEVPVALAPFEVSSQPLSLGAGKGSGAYSELSSLDVFTAAGADGDTLRALQLTPGVNSRDEGNALFVQGGDYNETTVFVDGVPIPTLKQSLTPVGSFQSSLRPYYLSKLSLYTGSIPVRFNDTLSGAVEMQTARTPAQAVARADIGLGSIWGMVQIPVTSNFGVAAAAGDLNSDIIYKLNPRPVEYRHAPTAQEVYLSADWKGTAESMQVVSFLQQSRLGLRLRQGNFDGVYSDASTAEFVIASAQRDFERGSLHFGLGASATKEREDYGLLGLERRLGTENLTLRWEKRVAPMWAFGAGTDLLAGQANLSGRLPSGASLAPAAAAFSLNSGRREETAGVYGSASWQPKPGWEIVPSLRYDLYTRPATSQLQPRVSAKVPAHVLGGDYFTFYLGKVARAPVASELATTPARLFPTRLYNVSLNYSRNVSAVGVMLGGFAKQYRDLNLMTSRQTYSGGGAGSAYGFQSGIAWQVATTTKVNLNYTFGHSRRMDPASGSTAPSPFEVRHSGALEVRQDFGRTVASMTLRAATGAPYTPILGAGLDPASGELLPTFGPAYSSRYPTNYRIDFALSRLCFAGRFPLVPYLSIDNLMNHPNTYAYDYSADYRQRLPAGRFYSRTVYFGASIMFY